MTFENLTPEQQEKAKACKTIEEAMAFAKAEGLELSEDDLQAIAGGFPRLHTRLKIVHDTDTNETSQQ